MSLRAVLGNRRGPRAAQGSALFVVIVLLALLALVGFFAAQVTVSDQLTSRSDVRAKTVNKVAEAGLSHAMEFIRVQRSSFLPKPFSDEIDPDNDPATPTTVLFSNTWERCAATDTDFPCGAASPSFRDQTFRFIGGAAGSDLSQRTLPLISVVNDPATATPPVGQITATIDGFPVSYRVGALLCPVAADPATGFAGCVAPQDASTAVVILASQGRIIGEDAAATISEALGVYRLLNVPPGAPPVVASGIIGGLGNGTIVANANSGGPGVAVSAWSRVAADPGGSWQTCQADEYFRTGPTYIESGVPVCDACACSTVLSTRTFENYDIIDRNNADGGVAVAPNPYPFPCDLFEYTFGFRARENLVAEPADGIANPPPPPFCETHIDADGDGTADVVQWLEANAKKVRAGGDFASCDDLIDNPLATGLIWAPGGCSLTGNAGNPRVGSPESPVLLVADGSFSIRGPTLFGLVFIRDPARVLNQATGGSGSYASGGGNGTIYGAVVMEGPGTLNGTLDIVSSPQLLRRLANSPAFNRMGRVPGSWNDLLSY